MLKLIKRVSKTAGLPPGTLIHIGERRTEATEITVIDYDAEQFSERPVERVEDCLPFKETATVTWINVNGVHAADVLERIGKGFDLHPLLLEDVTNTLQRPKVDDYEDHLFIVLKMLRYDDEEDGELHAEQVSLVMGPTYVISFQESPGDVFEVIRERIRKAKGRVRKMGADYLAYCLVDAIVDGYYAMLERIATEVENLEDEVVTNPTPRDLANIHNLKGTAVLLRRFIWPLRDVIGSLTRGGSPLIRESTLPYLRDVYDHTVQVIDTVETFREMISGLQDLYLSSVSNRMNEIMKVLTIMASIFIPLTFIAGIYGMNFDHMPELKWHWGYFAVLAIMVAIVLSMILFFRRKRWL
jgi:magnesium transporter